MFLSFSSDDSSLFEYEDSSSCLKNESSFFTSFNISSNVFACSIASKIVLPSMSSHGVVIIVACSLCSLRSETVSAIFLSFTFWVLLRTIVLALSTWLLKNSPKFFIYILHFETSTTVVALFITTSATSLTASTAFITSDNFPTPDGSIITLSGE